MSALQSWRGGIQTPERSDGDSRRHGRCPMFILPRVRSWRDVMRGPLVWRSKWFGCLRSLPRSRSRAKPWLPGLLAYLRRARSLSTWSGRANSSRSRTRPVHWLAAHYLMPTRKSARPEHASLTVCLSAPGSSGPHVRGASRSETLGGQHLAVTTGNGLSSPVRHYCEIDL
jgi:hypothetical protein